jgi:hypothetical protein
MVILGKSQIDSHTRRSGGSAGAREGSREIFAERGEGFFLSRWHVQVASIFDAKVLATTCAVKGYVAVACLSLDGKQTSS